MKIAVCDDEEYYVNNILERIRNFGVEDIQPNKFDGFTDPEEFMESFKFVRYDLVYLDIEFKEKNGIEMAYQIKDIMPSFLLALIMGIAVYFVPLICLIDYLVIPTQIAVGIIIYLLGSIVLKLDCFYFLLNAMKNMKSVNLS